MNSKNYIKSFSLYESELNEAAKPKIKTFNKVKVGDMGMENPDAGGVWDNEQGKILWKGNVKELQKSKYKGLEQDWIDDFDEDIENMEGLDLVVINMTGMGGGLTLFGYNEDPSSVVVFEGNTPADDGHAAAKKDKAIINKLKELENKLKGVKGNTPADKGKKAAIQDEIDSLSESENLNEDQDFVVTGFIGGYDSESLRYDYIVNAKNKADAKKQVKRSHSDMKKMSARPTSDFKALDPYEVYQKLDESVVNESRKVQVKRKYGSRLGTSISAHGPVRSKILSFISENDGVVTAPQILEFIKLMNEADGTKASVSWLKRNKQYVKKFESRGEIKYKLTGLGKRVIRATTINESHEFIFEGQFSWMTQDGDIQIGSERTNTINVYMFDDKGNKWEEKKYEGYGVFGGKDYFELLAEMNGYSKESADDPINKNYKDNHRQIGIDIAYGKLKSRRKGSKIHFPALVSNKNYNWKRHDFTKEAESDPNQSWVNDEEFGDDFGGGYGYR